MPRFYDLIPDGPTRHMHWTAGFRVCFISCVTFLPPVMCIVRQRTPSSRLRAGNRKSIIFDMKLQDIEQEALGLRESERAELVLSLMRTLAAPAADITDEEVFRRDAELETGSVEPMLHDEFVRRVREERGR